MNRYQITFETWNKLAQAYQDKFMELDLYNDSYDLFCKQLIQSEPKILELGCGPGNVTRYLHTQLPTAHILATDIAPNMVAATQVNIPSVQTQVLDCRTLHVLNKQFDAIMCGFCLPYLAKEDCAKLFKDCAALLSAGGIFYFSTIEGDYEQSGFQTGSTGDRSYVYYYQATYLNQLLDASGFKRIALLKKAYPSQQDTAQVHLVFIAQKR